MIWKLTPKQFWHLVAICSFLALAGCASDKVDLANTAVVVEGNGKCHPASDLPPHKTMKKVPEKATGLSALFDLFTTERHDHAKDVQDYNSLYDTCVNGK